MADSVYGKAVDGVSSTKTADSVHGKAKNGVPSTKMADSVHGKAVWAAVCTDSGMLAGPECPKTELLIPAAGLDSEPCPYHNAGEFVLPPAMEWYYKPHHPEYKGETRFRHELLLAPAPGKHTLTVVDGEGHFTSIRFTVAE